MDQDQLRYAAAAATLAGVIWMAGYGVYLRTRGVNANAVAERNTNWMQRFLILGAGFVDLYLVARAPVPALDAIFRALPAPFPIPAIALLLTGLAVIVAGQFSMGRSWRVGVPNSENHVDALVTTGMHKFSRNPVYLGVVLFLGGAFLAAPGPLTIAALIISYFGLTIIIRQEERYLSERFGERYLEYASRVRRWI